VIEIIRRLLYRFGINIYPKGHIKNPIIMKNISSKKDGDIVTMIDEHVIK